MAVKWFAYSIFTQKSEYEYKSGANNNFKNFYNKRKNEIENFHNSC